MKMPPPAEIRRHVQREDEKTNRSSRTKRGACGANTKIKHVLLLVVTLRSKSDSEAGWYRRNSYARLFRYFSIYTHMCVDILLDIYV